MHNAKIKVAETKRDFLVFIGCLSCTKIPMDIALLPPAQLNLYLSYLFTVSG